jgi:predicted DNA-binding protein
MIWDDDNELMVTAAHRYCLGRQSYIVGACINWVKKNHESFSNRTKMIMVRDIIEAIMDDCAGADFDTRGWKDLATGLYNNMSVKDQHWCKDVVRYKDKDWPL